MLVPTAPAVMNKREEPKRRQQRLIEPEVYCREDESSREQTGGRQARMDYRQSAQGGWQAGTGLVILGQGEHGDYGQDKT